MTGGADDFEPHRRYLAGLAYRMLGSVAEAEDVVQDAFLRWSMRRGAAAEAGDSAAERSDDGERSDDSEPGPAADSAHSPHRDVIEAPRAYLSRVVTRLCLDRLKSARARREEYVGTWLPEPLVESLERSSAGGGARDQASALALADDLSIALLVTMETLSPLERAAFLLHDVFDMDFSEIAGVLERSEAAVRQLATRARTHVRDGRPRFTPSPVADKLAAAFHAVLSGGRLDALTHLLAEDAVCYSDGGGKRQAALNPIYGRAKILRFFLGIARKGFPQASTRVESVIINGMPGFLLHTEHGVETMVLETTGEHISAIYIVRNPDKLRHLS